MSITKVIMATCVLSSVGFLVISPNVTQVSSQPTKQAKSTVPSSGYNAGLDKNVKAIKAAIIGQESNGNYRAVNADSGALGYAQVMPDNVYSWTKSATGKGYTPTQFLNNPELQHKTINHKLNEYWTLTAKYSSDSSIRARMVASIWYSGQAQLYDNGAQQYYNGRPYPSIRQYTLSALARAKAYGLE